LKYKKLRASQFVRDGKNINPDIETQESLYDIIGELKEEYFSDLNADEIPNSEVSDVSESEL